MPIPVQNNNQYGGNLINQKYAPLEVNAVAINNDAQNDYVNLFQQRIDFLGNQNLLPAQLNLYANDWDDIQQIEAAPQALPPIVVISSNRAEWMAEKYVLATNLLEYLGLGNFTDVNDTQALNWGSTLWYDPRRINNANRHVYIVVHREEYEHYRVTLEPTGMTVIGWDFASNHLITGSGIAVFHTHIGFGASRFAAIEFCKYLFTHQIVPGLPNFPIPQARQKAWLVDDNVVYVNGFPGFNVAENAMTIDIWGLGFKGATINSTEENIKKLTTPPQLGNLQNLAQQGLLQQCVLWNINQLSVNHLNFSPYFVTSNEDTSLSNYLQNHNPSRLRLHLGAAVFKASPTNDGSIRAINLAFLLRKAVIYFQLNILCQVNPTRNDQGGQQELNEYIRTHVLPNALANVRNENPALTQSRAVEQIMARIVTARPAWVPAAIFRPNGHNNQPTQHFIA